MSLDSFRLDNSPRMATGTNMTPFVVDEYEARHKIWPTFGYEGVTKRDNPSYKKEWLQINARNWNKLNPGDTIIVNIPMNGWVLSKLVQVGSSRRDRFVFQPVNSNQTFYTDGWNLWAKKVE